MKSGLWERVLRYTLIHSVAPLPWNKMVTTKDYPKGISWHQGQTGRRVGDKQQPVFRWGVQQLDWPLGQVALLTQPRPASFQDCLLGALSAVTTKSIRLQPDVCRLLVKVWPHLPTPRCLLDQVQSEHHWQWEAQPSHLPTAGQPWANSPGPGLPCERGQRSSVAFLEIHL